MRSRKVSEQMAQWSALLGDELVSWPQVTTRQMFGGMAYYRADSIFAILPVTREFFVPNQVGVKFPRSKPFPSKLKQKIEADERIRVGETFVQWLMFRIDTDADLRNFLEYVAYAHEDAGPA